MIVVLGLAGGAGWVGRDLRQPYRGFAGSMKLEIAPGTSAPDITDLLVARGVLAHRLPFLARYLIGRTRHRLKAGEYLFDRPLRPIEVYRKLVVGDVYLYQVVIPEGSDRFDMARILQDRLTIDPADFLRVSQDTTLIRDLDPNTPSLEGYLFPDTYRFPRRTTAATVVATMVARFRHILHTRLHDESEVGSEQLHTAVTIASLVEKETPNPAERPVVAGAFTRRLEKGMLLQCDPTVVYAAHLDNRPIGAIRVSDLNFESPFNTYRHAGLPPGPIASPGELSLRAALHPDDGDELYFVSDNHGGHVFASTLAEHLRNVARYRHETATLRRQAAPSFEPSDKAPTKRRSGQTPKSGRSKKSVSAGQQKADHS
jgi:UPF0755 protein